MHGATSCGPFEPHFTLSLRTSLLLMLPTANGDATSSRCKLQISDADPEDESWESERVSWVAADGAMSMFTFADMVHWTSQGFDVCVTPRLYAAYDAMWLKWMRRSKDTGLGMDLNPAAGRPAPVISYR